MDAPELAALERGSRSFRAAHVTLGGVRMIPGVEALLQREGERVEEEQEPSTMTVGASIQVRIDAAAGPHGLPRGDSGRSWSTAAGGAGAEHGLLQARLHDLALHTEQLARPGPGLAPRASWSMATRSFGCAP